MTRGASLHTRLTVGVLLLTALGLVLAAGATTLLLRQYLVKQVDLQLTSSPRFGEGSGGAFPPSGQQPGVQRQLPSPFVVTRLTNAGVVLEQTKGTQVADAPAPDLSGITSTSPEVTDGRPFDVAGIGDPSYSYRAVARVLPDGTGFVVAAVSTENIDDTIKNVLLAWVAVGLLTLGLVALLAGRVIGVGLRPLARIEDTAERIAEGDLSERVPDMPEGTEIGRLAESLNGMLGQIERAFDERRASEDRLRRFVADASHELRTPLTSIRGYAELTRSGAMSSDADRERAVARIEEEAARMGVLVDDLLLLARLDQHRPLDNREVDVVELVHASADALRMAATDRVVSVHGPESVLVIGDPTRLRQVLDNLAVNARVHTTPGSPVDFDVTVEGDVVRIEVRDQGPGMTEDEARQAFARFYRGDPSRSRARGAGTGLGLSIAQAVVEAHGGEVGLTSSPEGGTTVSVWLPLAARGAPAPTPERVPA